MNDRVDWKQVWEKRAAQRISDFEFDRGMSSREKEIGELATRELIDFIAPQPTDIVLDAGCGTGTNIFLLQDKVSRIIGMDYAGGAIARCERRIGFEKIENVELLHGDITGLPLTSDSVDKVICSSVFQYLDDDAVRTSINEFSRVLKQGGFLILHVKNLASLYLSTLTLAKKLKVAIGKDTKLEFFRSFRWYYIQLVAQGFEVVTYNSFNLFMFELMPERLLHIFQKLELKHRGNIFFRSAFTRRCGSDLKIKAQLVKR
jgi:ubiquinone/menaquinone biosynthesis C-methylase UbiE